MNTVVEFFDLFQEKVNALYAEKFRIDEAERVSSRRPAGELDPESIYLGLAALHDQVRSIDFEKIQSRKWQEEVETSFSNPKLTPFYNLYTRLAASAPALDLVQYVAQHIVLNPLRPLRRYSSVEYPEGQLTMAAFTKEAEINNLVNSVASILRLRPYLVFLHCLSTLETSLPTGAANVSK